jgi:hypothetical protein
MQEFALSFMSEAAEIHRNIRAKPLTMQGHSFAMIEM